MIKFTNFTPNFSGVIDYIWYNPSTLSVLATLGGLSEDYLEFYVGFPTPHVPSEYIFTLYLVIFQFYQNLNLEPKLLQ